MAQFDGGAQILRNSEQTDWRSKKSAQARAAHWPWCRLRRLAVLQCGQHLASAWPLDAHFYHSEPVIGTDGLQGV